MQKLKSNDVRAYFVWLPVLRADNKKAAETRAAELVDTRALRLWDGKRALGWKLGKLLKIPSRAKQKINPYGFGLGWDIYLAYAPGIRWEKEPPKPTYWMHQLWGVKNAPKLKGETLYKQILKILPKKKER